MENRCQKQQQREGTNGGTDVSRLPGGALRTDMTTIRRASSGRLRTVNKSVSYYADYDRRSKAAMVAARWNNIYDAARRYTIPPPAIDREAFPPPANPSRGVER